MRRYLHYFLKNTFPDAIEKPCAVIAKLFLTSYHSLFDRKAPSCILGASVAFLLLMTTQGIALGQNTALLSPTTNSNNNGVNNPNQAYLSDDSYATFSTNGENVLYKNFNITIPAGNMIVGIEVKLEGNIFNNRDLNISLTWDNGASFTAEKAMTRFSTSDVSRTVGGSADTWGHSWSLSEITNANFGIECLVPTVANGNLYLDHIQVRVYYAPGQIISSTGLFKVPAGVTCIKVETWGGGGSGGSGDNENNSRGGGGGGAYARSFLAVIPGADYSVTIGAGGIPTSNNNNSTSNGGNTSFGTLVIAAGGTAGTDAGGIGGAKNNSTGDIRFAGGTGGYRDDNHGGGGGGGSAFTTANGNNGADGGNPTGGNGGTGAGNGGIGGTDSDGLRNGSSGNTPGGGGGGKADNGDNSGTGANGRIIITWVGLNSTITPVVNSPILAGATTITGTSEPNAAIVIYTAGTTQIGTGTSNSSGIWSVAVSVRSTGQNITVTAKVVDKCLSSASTPVIVSSANSITTGTINGSPFCAGATVSVPFTITGTFTSGNDFKAQLSNSSGNFASAVDIGTLSSTNEGTISGTIPAGIPSGAGYMIRVISSNPVVIGTANGSNLTVSPNLPVSVSIATSANPICAGTSVTFTATPTNGGTVPVYQWNLNGTNVGSGGAAYTNASLANGNTISCVLTSNASPCATGSPATSNTVTMILNAAPIITLNKTDVTCPINNDGVINTSLSGGLSNIRYIKLTQQFADWTNLAELEAFEVFTGTNVALAFNGAIASASSIYGGGAYPASEFNDGISNMDGNMWHSGSGNTGEWVRVDLGGTKNIDYLRIHNRVDCCQDRSQNLLLELFDASNNLVYSKVINVYDGINAAHFIDVNVLDLSWLDGGTTMIRTGLNAGAYTINYADGNGCTSSASANIGTTNNIPAAPTAIAGSGAMCTQITANWNASANATSYMLDVSTEIGFGSFIAGYADRIVGNVTSYAITGLISGTTYYYRVRAMNSCGISGNSNIINFATSAVTPAQPGLITGSQTPCQASSQIYSVTNVAGVTYTWTFPADWTQTGGGTTNSIIVTIGTSSGNVQVTPSTACGNGTARTQAVTVTPTVGIPTTITISAGTEPTCQLINGITQTTYTTAATNSTGFNWSLNNAAAGVIDATTGVMSWANGFSGNVNMQVTANGCNGPSSQIIKTVTVTPTVGIPVFSLGATSIYCKGAGSATYTATATNSTGITYSLDAPSLAGGNSIVAGSGVVTYVAGWSGSSIITASAAGCNGPKISTHAVTINDALPVSVSISASTNHVCAGNVTYTATPFNGGAAPAYQWKVNGANVGTGSTTYTYVPLNNDVITCVLTSSLQCVSGNPATSNAQLMLPWITNNSLDFVNGNHGTICSTTNEYAEAVITAPAGTNFIHVGFASYGTPEGDCTLLPFTLNLNCNAASSRSVVEGYLLGNNTATFPVINATFGDPCPDITKRLYVQATYTEPICAGTLPATITGTIPTGGNGIDPFTYLWESSTTGPTSDFAAASGTNSNKDYTPGALSQTTWYRRKVTSGDCSDYSAVILIKVTPLPVATFSYTTPFCSNAANPSPVFSGGGVAGTFSSTTGLVFVSTATGEVNLGASTPGTYTVTNTIAAAGGCGIITATSPLSITPLPIATFNYTGSPYCSAGTNPTPYFIGNGVAGTFSSTTGLVFISTATGELNLATSTPGTYTVTNTIAAANGCGVVTATSSPITITQLPAATISYIGTPFCTSNATAQPVTRTGTAGGTYSALPAGLTIASGTGEIIPAGSTPGTYTVTYTIAPANGCGAVTSTTSVIITAEPTATISYAGAPFCKTVSTAQAVTLTGTGAYTLGNFNSTAGLIINSGSGAITPGTSTAGAYTVTYTIPASAGCAAKPVTTSVTITAAPVATFSYSGSPYCSNAANPSPTFSGGGFAGTFTSTSGLNFVSATTGQINLATSTPGTYTVTNTIAASGGCASVSITRSVTITPLPKATFSYLGSPYCSNASNPSPTFSGGGVAGTFTSTAGLNFVSATTGQINLTTSTAGTYTVTNTIIAAGGCAVVSATSSVTITKLPVATFNYGVTSYCSNAANPLPAFTGGGVAGTFSATPAGLVFVSTATGQVDMTLSAAGTYTITNTIAASGGCGIVTSNNNITLLPRPTISLDYCANPGTIKLTATGGATPTSYVWQSPLSGNTNTAVTDIAGVYGVQVTNGACVETIFSGVSNEMAINGNFELGEPGRSTFVTDYGFRTATGTLGSGLYGIGKDANAYYTDGFKGSHDHTTGNGYFMIVDGTDNSKKVWQQTFIVKPNTTYYFAAWALNIYRTDGKYDPNLTFSINGDFSWSTNVLVNEWTNNDNNPWLEKFRFYGKWNSGSATEAIVQIRDLQTSGQQNDFGLDDISFGTMDPFPAVLTSAPFTIAQTVCINTPIVNITYSTTGATGAGIVWTPSLPAGITCVFANNEAKISGKPTVAGSYSYTMTLSGCGPTEYKTGTLVVLPDASIASVIGTSPLCIAGTATYATSSVVLGGGTGAWSSSNTAVATVNSASGLVTGIAAGTCDIIYTIAGGCSGTKSASKSIIITPNASIASVSGTTPLCISGTATFTANTAVLGGGTGAWSSSNAAIATVNSSGLVTGVAAGTCNIIYTITGGCGGTVFTSFAVTINPNASIASVTGTTPLCIAGTAIYAANSVVLGGGAGSWSSSNTAVATVNPSSGLVTGVTAGTCNIIYTITGGCSGTKSALQSVTITPNASIGSVTGSTPLCPAATAIYSANLVVSSGGTGAWSTSNTAIATVDAAGLVTGVSAGTCNIIYTLTGGCGGTISKQQSITITPNASIASVTGASPLCGGATANYLANTVNLGGGGTGVWSSSNNATATVSTAGLVTGVAPGTCNIIYTITGGCGGTVSALQPVTISPNASVGTVTGASPLCIAATATYTASAIVLSGGTGAWSSASPAVATVDAAGLVTGKSAGTCDIIYTITGGCGVTVSSRQSVTITPSASITSINGLPWICTGATTTYSVIAVLSGGTGAWSSSNIAVATVDPNSGVVTGQSEGSSDIIYTITGGCGGTKTALRSVTVAAPIPQTITGITPLCIGSAEIWTSTTAGGTWQSATPAIATVHNVTGLVTGISAGTADIIYVYSFHGCVNSATNPVTIAAPPTCAISGPVSVSPASDETYSSTSTPNDNVIHSWSITGNGGTIPNPSNGPTVTVTTGTSGWFTLTDNISRLGCTSSCSYNVIVCGILPFTASVPNGTITTYTAPAGMESWNWSFSGNASIPSGIANQQTVTVLAGNTCDPYTISVEVFKNGVTTSCSQTITTSDNINPTFTLPTLNVGYCVENIYQAVYKDGDEGTPTDITFIRPDYYLFAKESTMLNLSPMADNCAFAATPISWTIDFGNNGTNDLIGTGQLSTFVPIAPMTGIEFPLGTNRITYTVTDASGNFLVKYVDLIVTPRPDISKNF